MPKQQAADSPRFQTFFLTHLDRPSIETSMVSPNPRRRVLANAIAVALPLMVYMLSVGPVFLVAAQEPSMEPVLGVYRPLFFIAEQAPWVSDLLTWYIRDVCGAPVRARGLSQELPGSH